VIIDLRTPGERRIGSWPGSISLPIPKPPVNVQHVRERLRQFLVGIPKDEPISVYCAKGLRSSVAASLLKDMGFSNVTNLGGFA